MKNFNKSLLALFTASILTTSAFAAGSDDNAYNRLSSARADVKALSTTLENMGAKVDASVNLNGANTLYQKETAYNTKISELQAQFNEINTAL